MCRQTNAVRLELLLQQRLQLAQHQRRAVPLQTVTVVGEQRFRVVQLKVDAGRTLLAQQPHALEQLAPVGRILYADRVQIGIADLLADLQIVVPIVEEAFRVLAQPEGAQPLAHDVAHRHPVASTFRLRLFFFVGVRSRGRFPSRGQIFTTHTHT